MTPDVIEGGRPIGKPKDWDEARDGKCSALHVRFDHHPGGTFMTSAWRPEADEIGWMLAGANIHLGISAPRHPVVNLGVAAPPSDGEPVWTIMPAADLNGSPSVLVTMYDPRAGFTRRGGTIWIQVEVKNGGLAASAAQAIAAIQAKAKELGLG